MCYHLIEKNCVLIVTASQELLDLLKQVKIFGKNIIFSDEATFHELGNLNRHIRRILEDN